MPGPATSSWELAFAAGVSKTRTQGWGRGRGRGRGRGSFLFNNVFLDFSFDVFF